MYQVKCNTGAEWDILYTNPDFAEAKKWAINHISYTGSKVLRVEIHDTSGCCDVIFSKNWTEQ